MYFVGLNCKNQTKARALWLRTVRAIVDGLIMAHPRVVVEEGHAFSLPGLSLSSSQHSRAPANQCPLHDGVSASRRRRRVVELLLRVDPGLRSKSVL